MTTSLMMSAGLRALRRFERQPAVGGGGDAVAVLLEDVLQPLGLRGAVFRDQDFTARRRDSVRVRS